MTLISNKKLSPGNLQSKYLFLFNTHLGSKRSFRNKEMDEYLFGFDNLSTSVFHVEKTMYLLKRALKFLALFSSTSNKKVLFVGTGLKSKKITKFLGEITGQAYVHHRWVKGFLTNWENICSSIKFYKLFLKKLNLSKKREYQLKQTFKGISMLNELPGIIFIIDVQSNYEVLFEAKRLAIPTIAIVDNDTKHMDKIDYPIICNKNSPLSLFFVISLVVQQLKK